MLEEEIKKIAGQRRPAKNLKNALLALGYVILAGIVFYVTMDSFGPGGHAGLTQVLMGLHIVLTVVAASYAFFACWNSVVNLRTNKDGRNYAALVIGGIVLIAIGQQLMG